MLHRDPGKGSCCWGAAEEGKAAPALPLPEPGPEELPALTFPHPVQDSSSQIPEPLPAPVHKGREGTKPGLGTQHEQDLGMTLRGFILANLFAHA